LRTFPTGNPKNARLDWAWPARSSRSTGEISCRRRIVSAKSSSPATAITTLLGAYGWCERAGQHEYAALAPLVFDAEASDSKAAQLLNVAAQALDAIALALDPDGRLPLVVSGSIGGRLQNRLAPSIRARLVAPAGDAIDGALRLIRAQLE
jgi:glucosamine kinase